MDNVLLSYFRQAIAHELGEQDREDPGFPGTARLVKRLQHSTRNGKELQERGTRIMRSLLPAMLVRAFGAFLGILPNWFTARHAASAMVLTTNWLVGPSAVNDAPSDLLPDDRSMVPTSVAAALMERDLKPAGYRQGVLVKRCRVLEETKCASVCLNICQVCMPCVSATATCRKRPVKRIGAAVSCRQSRFLNAPPKLMSFCCQGPTQKFFTEDVGLPLTMLPNYDTFECQFVFGRDPPPPVGHPAL